MKRMLVTVALTLVLAVPAAAATLKIATVAPEGSDWMEQMRAGAAQIKERTDGRVQIKFYGGGVMGNDAKVLRKMRIGQLHGGAFPVGSLNKIYPDVQLYGLPLLFENIEEVDYVRERMDERLLAGLDEAGLVSFGFAGGAFAKFMSSEPVRSMADLKGRKVWVPEGDEVSYAAMERLGLAPVVLPITDVLTGLQTGLVEIIGTTQVGALVLQWHTKVKYVTDYPLSYIYATLVIDKKAFSRLSSPDQAVVREVMEGIYARFDQQNRIDEKEAAVAMRDSGIDPVEADLAEVPRWREHTAQVNREMAEKGAVSAELLAELNAHLAELRGAPAQAAVPASR